MTTEVNDAVSVLVRQQWPAGDGKLVPPIQGRHRRHGATSSALMKLRPVTFHYKTDSDTAGRRLQYGLIAEEVAEVYPGWWRVPATGRSRPSCTSTCRRCC